MEVGRQDSDQSTCHLLSNVSGTPVCQDSICHSSLQQPKHSQALYEDQPESIVPNHDVLQENAQRKESDGPRHASSSSQGHSTANPGMLPEMTHVANLHFTVEGHIVRELNKELHKHGLRRVLRICDAVYRLGNKYACKEEKEEILKVLIAFFSGRLGSDEDAKEAIREWPVLVQWCARGLALAHPLGNYKMDSERLQILKEQVLQAPVYAPVRFAAMALIAAAEEALAMASRPKAS